MFIFVGYLFVNVLITLPLLPLLNVSMSWLTVDLTRAVSNKDLIIPHSHLSICKTSVSNSGATFWNSLPIEVRNSSSLSILNIC